MVTNASLEGETRIVTSDSGHLSIRRIVEDFRSGLRHRVYSYWPFYNLFVNRWIINASSTGYEDVCRLILTNGHIVHATSNNYLIKYNGAPCKLESLNTGDYLLPFINNEPLRNLKPLEVAGIEYLGKREVFSIEVEDLHNFALSTGVVIANNDLFVERRLL